MSKNGVTKEDLIVIPRTDETNIIQTSTLYQQTSSQDKRQSEQLDLTDEYKDIDTDSGVSSLRQLRSKAGPSNSKSNITFDEELEDEGHYHGNSSINTEIDNQDRRLSDISLMTNFTTNKTTSDLQLSSRTSSHGSDLNITSTISTNAMMPVKSSSVSQATGTSVNDRKEKHGVRQLIRKIFKPSASPLKTQGNTRITSTAVPKSPVLDIDLKHRTAYPPMSPLPVTQGPIRLLILRHGERLDRYYSSQWLRQAFDRDGNFCRFSPILPETLPFRASIRDFDLDPPLTYKGLKDAYHTGTVLKDKSIHINVCYSSPALRCVQTAAKILEGLQLHNKVKIRIESGLFECTGWYTANETSNVLTMPRFMTKKELLENKYQIDKSYHEQMTYADISQLENELEFYQRCHAVTAKILKIHETEYINQIQQGLITAQHPLHVLFIAHAPNLETCTRKLCGGKFRPDSLPHVIRNVDFLTMTVIEKPDNNSDKWIFRRSSFYGDEF